VTDLHEHDATPVSFFASLRNPKAKLPAAKASIAERGDLQAIPSMESSSSASTFVYLD